MASLTPDQRDYARIATIITGLRMELGGIKPTHGFAGVKLAKEYGYAGRTKQGALEYLRMLQASMLDFYMNQPTEEE